LHEDWHDNTQGDRRFRSAAASPLNLVVEQSENGDIGEVDPADDPVSFPGEHHEIEAGPVAARLMHSISQPPVHIRWMLGCLHQCGR
jgi:hypothetical protein